MRAPRVLRVNDGSLAIECNGQHPFAYHRYYFYTKKEARSLWLSEHSSNSENSPTPSKRVRGGKSPRSR